jgi:HlyD family secretion protein
LQAQLRRAEIAVQAAQREYDKIAWLPEAAATEAADELQNATIGLEEAQAAFEEATLPPTQAEIETATSAAQSAQDALNQLQLMPTAAELASAQAAVAEAEAALDDLQEGPQEAAVRQAELGVRNAMIALEDARLAQSAAQVVSPIDGTVLTVDVDLGQQAEAGDVVATLADTTDLKLTVNVEQRDIARVHIGQQVQIAVYALPNDVFTGVVEQIAPVADAGTGFVTFPVIIRFTEGPVEKLLPGMTASATFADSEVETPAQTPSAGATPEATEEATVEPAEEAGEEEATPEATVEETETEEATDEAAEEATPEETEESTEEPAAEATATPSN